jgi:predicted heme/steroid binding protein
MADETMKAFTKEELSKYDGSNGIAYIACYGKVYDVSASYQWRKGVHQVTHRAGCDLTDDLERAPHDFSLLEKFPVVGELVR